ncbi:MAG TPA: alpha/beta hydrolase-fold protein [Bryobacteraceae bacterium]|jgi:S-formylglutathione hydrolase|nr:alpha/beta hydrolase-fold protein [Bryobacteraceae bacterium]
MPSNIEFSELSSEHLPEAVQYATIAPRDAGPLPLCILLMGGGGSRQSLLDCQPLFDRWWEEGALAPMVFATPSAGMSYYVEDPIGDRWDSFVIEDFIPHLRAVFHTGVTAITGISMGGYGALKIAFAHPELFAAVTAMNPMIEPGLADAAIGARNRIHHAAGGPARLIGPSRDSELFAANNPSNRAIANAVRIRESGLPIYIEAGDNDFVNAHDGTEFLHRVLWDLDISHEYHLVRGADHGGPTFRPRMRAKYVWLSAALGARTPAEPAAEQLALNAIRAQIEPLRERAAASDSTTLRRFGILPGSV